MENRIQLKLIGITYNQIESGVYALILQETDGERRLPIIIGYPEAQAIECKMQEVVTPRPLTHDLFVSALGAFRIDLREVRIHRMPNGVFAADLVFEGPKGELYVVDSRSSDAIALAIRTGSPIFTTSETMESASVLPGQLKEEGEKQSRAKAAGKGSGKISSKTAVSLSALPDGKLEKMLEKAVENEDYEKAGEIKKELDKRNGLQ